LVQILRKRVPRLRSIVLFGSIARGDAGPSTDVDLIVVSDSFPKSPSKSADIIIEAFEALKETDEYDRLRSAGIFLNIDPIGYRAADLGGVPPLMLDVAHEGILLFDDGFMEKVLDEVSARLKRLGARRVRTKSGWYWDLKPDYKFGEAVEI